MRAWQIAASRISRGIDQVSEVSGRILTWLTLVMVLVASYNTVVRYLGRYTGTSLSSNAYIELQWYLFSILFLLGAAYTLRHNGHVRVDVVYQSLSTRSRAWVNLLGTVLFLIPFCVLMIWVSWPTVAMSFSIREMSPDPGGLPRYPIKAMIPLGFGLLALQAVSEGIKSLLTLTNSRSDSEADLSSEGRYGG
jgi:TRAP-type mannitol/chloroaromatic compound transport system permease small subunit